MISCRFVFFILIVLSLSLTSCVREIENGSTIEIHGVISPNSESEVMSSQFYLSGTVSYYSKDESDSVILDSDGKPKIRNMRYGISYETRIEVSPDFHYKVELLVGNLSRKEKTLVPAKINLRIIKVNGAIHTPYSLRFSDQGILNGALPGTYQVEALDIAL